jgi:hypothetical protein
MKLQHSVGVICVLLLAVAAAASGQALSNGKVLIPNPAELPYSGAGSAVAISGTTAVVGAPYGGAGVQRGSAHVFVWNGSAWTTEATLSSGDPDEMDQFGLAVALQGDTILIAAPFATSVPHDTGAVYVFERTGTTWAKKARLQAPSNSAPSAFFGAALALDGNTAVVSDYANTGDPGRLLVFSRINGAWDVANPKVVDPHQPENGSLFGGAVAMQGDFIVAGAPNATIFGQPAHGVVQVFERVQGTWTWKVSFFLADTVAGDGFGSSVAIDGEYIVAGSPFKDNNAGAAYSFHKNGNAWTAADGFWARLPNKNPQTDDIYGFNLHKSGATLLIGAPGRDNDTGAVYGFTDLTGTAYGTLNVPSPGTEQFGWSTGIDGARAVSGANIAHDNGLAFAYDVTTPVTFPRFNWTFILWPYKYIYMGCPIDLVANGAAAIDLERGELPLSFQIGQQPRNGTLRFSTPTTLVYQPNRGFTGRDVFTLRVTDRAGVVLEKTANVTVWPSLRQ